MRIVTTFQTLLTFLSFSIVGCGRDAPQNAASLPPPSTRAETPGAVTSLEPQSSNSTGEVGNNQEALAYMKYWLEHRFVATPAGWLTKTRVAFNLFTAPNQAPRDSDYVTYVAQLKTLELLTVEADPLSEADRLNGIQWQGRFNFGPTVFRVSNSPFKEWSEWLETGGFSVHAQRKRDLWTLSPELDLLAGPAGVGPPGAVAGALGSPSESELKALAEFDSPEAVQRREILSELQKLGPPD